MPLHCNDFVRSVTEYTYKGLCPAGLNIRKKPFIEFESDDLIIFWKENFLSTENDLLEALCVVICERMFTLEKTFWDELQELHKNNREEDMSNWLIKLHVLSYVWKSG